jgi:hypothetical protein
VQIRLEACGPADSYQTDKHIETEKRVGKVSEKSKQYVSTKKETEATAGPGRVH